VSVLLASLVTTKEQRHAYRWNRERYSHRRRFIDIWTFVLQLLASRWWMNRRWSYRGENIEGQRAQRRRSQAVWIRETLLELGPTFIKVGQLFSTRADLFPAEYVEELAKLQDRVPAFGYELVEKIILQDFGKTIPQLFRSFDPVPLAAASLGQVHRAQLSSGEAVVVKVQRPGLKKLFSIDLKILKGITHYFQNHPKWGPGRDWLGIYEECCRILYEEIDYLNEGRNADTFRRNFREYDWVYVPRVFWRYSTPRALTLEYVPGIKISHYEALEAAGLDRTVIARLGAKAYFHQLLDHGFFHADPHPGNLAVSPEGSLIFYDFGMMGQVVSVTREKLLNVFFSIANKDANQLIIALIDLGALTPVDDMGPIRRSMQYMLNNFIDQPFETQSVAQIGDDLFEIAYDQPFRFPATFTFVMRAFSTIEGVGKGLDPKFNFMEVAQPFATELMTRGSFSQDQQSGLFNELSRQAAQVSNTAINLPRRVEQTLDKLEQGDLRLRVRSQETDRILRRLSYTTMGINYALLMGAFLLSATILLVNKYLWLAGIAIFFSGIIGIGFLRIMRRINRYDRYERML
jgi:predicted unusual protein kinase regulating ubiquinone biosynthesis (AarF/ABC1/UbiB family)